MSTKVDLWIFCFPHCAELNCSDIKHKRSQIKKQSRVCAILLKWPSTSTWKGKKHFHTKTFRPAGRTPRHCGAGPLWESRIMQTLGLQIWGLSNTMREVHLLLVNAQSCAPQRNKYTAESLQETGLQLRAPWNRSKEKQRCDLLIRLLSGQSFSQTEIFRKTELQF